MNQTSANKLNVLYIGNDQAVIQQFVESGLFEITVMPNGL